MWLTATASILAVILLVSLSRTSAQETNVNNCDVTDIRQYLEAEGIFSGTTFYQCLSSPPGAIPRCFHVFVPDTVDFSASVPLVMDIHGTNSCPGHMVDMSGWAQKAIENRFVIVWPIGVIDPNLASEPCFNLPGGLVAGGWLNGQSFYVTPGCCCEGSSAEDTQDVDVLTEILNRVSSDTFFATEGGPSIDTSRIYLAGHSNGCVAALTLAGSSSDLIAGVACHAGGMTTPIPATASSVPIWLAVGEDDFIDLSRGLPPLLASPLYTLDAYAAHNKCQDRFPDQTYGIVTTRTWTNCDNDADVVLVSIAGVGHKPYLGFDGLEVDTTQLAWEFLVDHSVTKAPTQMPAQFNPRPTPPPVSTDSDIVGKTICGYQGFFGVPQDGYTWLQWNFFDTLPRTGSVTVDMFPDMGEYTESYETGLGFLGNDPNRPAEVFSSYRQSTIDLHMSWMEEYGIDGIALQRFPSIFGDVILQQQITSQLQWVRQAAEAHGRTFYIMYDVTKLEDEVDGVAWYDIIENDLVNTIEPLVTSSSSYAHHYGRPVVCIWGIGFRDELLSVSPDTKPGTADEYKMLIERLQSRNYFVAGGVPLYWRTNGGIAEPGFEQVYKALDLLSPWSVGRFESLQDIENYASEAQADLDYCRQRGIVYQPVVSPGFSFHNGAGLPFNQISRQEGKYLWRHFHVLAELGISSAYVAMFDEYNEGTAIMKAASDSTVIPHDQIFLSTSADGTFLSSDFYLRLVGHGTKVLRGEVDNTVNVPIPDSVGPVWFRSGFEPDIDATPMTDSVYESTQVGVDQARLFVDQDSPLGFTGGYTASLRCQGVDPDPTGPSFVYFQAFSVDIPVTPETFLSYWFLPDNENGRRISVDLIIRDPSSGLLSTLRDSGAVAQTQVGSSENPVDAEVLMHPGVPKGVVGQVTRVTCQVGSFVEGRIETILVAYDRGERSLEDGPDFGAHLDDLQITGSVLPFLLRDQTNAWP